MKFDDILCSKSWDKMTLNLVFRVKDSHREIQTDREKNKQIGRETKKIDRRQTKNDADRRYINLSNLVHDIVKHVELSK